MAVVSVAIMISFHLKHEPSPIELKLALPFGIVFWFLALACLINGFANYIKTVTYYSRRAALVQSGWKTQVVRIPFLQQHDISCSSSPQIFTVVATAIVAACVLFLSTNASSR